MAGFFVWVLVAHCAGDGCNSGCSCMEPLPEPFPAAEEIPGAIQLRLTKSGLTFLGTNSSALVGALLPDGLDFDIPANCDMQEIPLLGSIHLCGDKSGDTCVAQDPPCQLQASINSMKLTPQASSGDTLKLLVRIGARTPPDAPITTRGAIKCTVSLDSTKTGAPDIGFLVDVKFKLDSASKRTIVTLQNPSLADLDNGDISFGGDLLCLAGNLGFLKGFLITEMEKQLTGEVQKLAAEQLCLKCDADTPCPSGALCDIGAGVCMLGDGCLQGLGTEGRISLAELPGAPAGGVDMLAWLGGTVGMANDGVSLGMIGGFATPTTAACVKPRPELKPNPTKPIPFATLMQNNTDTTGDAFHVGIGIHKSWLEQAGWSFYSSGALCLEVGTEMSDMLTSGTFSLLMPSLTRLTGPDPVPVRLVIRPTYPPEITLAKGEIVDNGDGSYDIKKPLIEIGLKDFMIDFHALVDDRYVRLFRLTSDLVIPLGLALTGDGQIQPIIGDLKEAFGNVRVTESELLKETPQELQTKFPVVLGVASSLLPIDQLASGFALPDLGGLLLQEAKFTSIANDEMLAIFARLAKPAVPTPTPAMPADVPVETQAQLARINMPTDRQVMRLRSPADLARGPEAIVEVPSRSATNQPLQYAWRIDGGLWSPFVAPDDSFALRIRDPLLFLLGEHRLELRARVAGQPRTTDPTPAVLMLKISVPARPVVGSSGAPAIDAQAGGCNVAATNASGATTSSWSSLLLLALGLLVVQRRRRLLVVLFSLLLVVAAGCSSSSSSAIDGGGDGDAAAACGDDEYMCKASNSCEAIERVCKEELSCNPGEELDHGAGPFMDEEACEPIPQSCSCTELPPLKHGALGRYSALVAVGDSLLASAYESKFGDLVVVSAKISDLATTTKEIIDGLPADGVPIAGPSGYRGGVADDGEDVGLYTDIAASDSAVFISYRDATNNTLKVAVRGERAWDNHVVAEAAGDEIVGRFTALTVDTQGKPAVAFTVLNIPAGDGTYTAELRWAAASKAVPAAAGDWAISVIDSAPMPCRNLCASGEACFLAADGSSQCKKPSSGCSSCGEEEQCLDGKCAPVLIEQKFATPPVGVGLWPEVLQGQSGPIVIYNDGVNGTLKMASLQADAWQIATVVGDGTTGPIGAFCSAAFHAGFVHVAHQDPVGERLLYSQIDTNMVPVFSPPEVIDDGIRGDGKHAVGADSAIIVVGSEVRVIYQDQQNSDLLGADRAGPSSWTPKDSNDPDLGRLVKGEARGYGFYSDLVEHNGRIYGSTFYFDASADEAGDIEFFELK